MRTLLTRMLLTPLILAASPAFGVRGSPDVAPDQDETMRPTKHGLRMTPRLARAITRTWLADLTGLPRFPTDEQQTIDLTPEQRSELTEAVTRRMMRMAHDVDEDASLFIEGAFESMLVSQGRFTPELGRPFAERAEPMIPAARAFLKGVSEDSRSLLKPEQFELLQKKLDKQNAKIDRFAEQMKRWAAGEVEEGEGPFDGLEEPDEKDESDNGGMTDEEKQRKQAIRHATRMAEWDMKQLGAAQWKLFLSGATFLFKFDPEQTAKAEAILADHQREADALMTDEWKQRLRRNRTQYHLGSRVGELAVGPWTYHLEREYTEATRPIEDLGLSFRRKVIALATDEQREAVLTKVRQAVERHGMTFSEADVRILGLARDATSTQAE